MRTENPYYGLKQDRGKSRVKVYFILVTIIGLVAILWVLATLLGWQSEPALDWVRILGIDVDPQDLQTHVTAQAGDSGTGTEGTDGWQEWSEGEDVTGDDFYGVDDYESDTDAVWGAGTVGAWDNLYDSTFGEGYSDSVRGGMKTMGDTANSNLADGLNSLNSIARTFTSASGGIWKAYTGIVLFIGIVFTGVFAMSFDSDITKAVAFFSGLAMTFIGVIGIFWIVTQGPLGSAIGTGAFAIAFIAFGGQKYRVPGLQMTYFLVAPGLAIFHFIAPVYMNLWAYLDWSVWAAWIWEGAVVGTTPYLPYGPFNLLRGFV